MSTLSGENHENSVNATGVKTKIKNMKNYIIFPASEKI